MVFRYIDSDGKRTIIPAPQLHATALIEKHMGDYLINNITTCNTFSNFEER